MSADGSRLLVGDGSQLMGTSRSGMSVLWNMSIGKTAYAINESNGNIQNVGISRDGQRLLTMTSVPGAVIWDANTKQRLSILNNKQFGKDLTNNCASFSDDGQHVVTGSANGVVILWNASTGNALGAFDGRKFGWATDVAISPDGRRVLSRFSQKDDRATSILNMLRYRTIVWDATTGKIIWTPEDTANSTNCVAISSNGRRVLTGHTDGTTVLWELLTGETVKRFAGHSGPVTGVAICDGDESIVTGSNDGSAVLWDIVTGQPLRRFSGETGPISDLAISSDSRFLSTTTHNVTSVWDTATGQELVRLISLNNGKDWLAVTPEGLFDGTEGGLANVSFRIGHGLKVVPVNRLFQDFHREGLLARIWNGERPMPEVDITGSVPPSLKFLSPEKDADTSSPDLTVEVEIRENGGGFKGPFLRHNGARVAIKPKVERTDESTQRYSFTVRLVEGRNQLSVEAASGDGAWESEPAQMTLTYNKSLDKPNLYVLAVGINKYAESALELGFASADAEAMTSVFSERGTAFYDRVHVKHLLDDEATKSGIRSALREIAGRAREQDTLMVFLSGHGTAIGQRYYFIPADFRFATKRFEDDLEDQGLPGDQIFRAMGETRALKRILVLDTCNSGAAMKRADAKQRSPFAFAGTIRRLSRSQGVFTIAASSATDSTAEVRELGHGVLTYSLLRGLKALPTGSATSADGNGDGVVNISEWFGYAAAAVPELTQKYLGVAQDVHQQSDGVSFPVLPLPSD